eukprot:1281720-Alexandrium_andersonii.AAC.1
MEPSTTHACETSCIGCAKLQHPPWLPRNSRGQPYVHAAKGESARHAAKLGKQACANANKM